MSYGVLKGKIREFCRDDDQDPHSELLMVAGDEKDRIAINVRSSRGPVDKRLVEYVIIEDLRHPLLDFARTLGEGWTPLEGPGQKAHGVDFIRNNMFRASDMKPIVHTAPGLDNDLFEKVEALSARARKSGKAVYAYGQKWGPEAKEDQYFRFTPGNGVHMIHMNQGDRKTRNAKYQDGALFLEMGDGSITGLFIKFQNQAWHTDEVNGDPLDVPVNAAPITPPASGVVDPWRVVPEGSPYHLARIVGAMVNPAGVDVGKETVTIFNTATDVLDLNGWKLLDAQDREELLTGVIHPGYAITLPLGGKGALLGNEGGTITLVEKRGLKVDGVAYTKRDVQNGRALAF